MSLRQFDVMSDIPSAPLVRRRDADVERKHQCPTCARSFKRKEHYQRHLRSHTNERPFVCKQCSKTFGRRDLLIRHHHKLHPDSNLSDSLPPIAMPTSMPTSSSVSGAPTLSSPHRQSLPQPPLHALPDSSHPKTAESNNTPQHAPVRPNNTHFGLPLEPVVRDSSRRLDNESLDPPHPRAGYNLHSRSATDVSVQSSSYTSPPDQISMASNRSEMPVEKPTSASKPSSQDKKPASDVLSPDCLRPCLQTYFDVFDNHIPLFHLPTFVYKEEPQSLIHILAAIGALYRMERQTAENLYHAAENMLTQTILNSDSDEAANRWKFSDARTLLLVIAFGALHGSQEVVHRALSRLGRLCACYRSLASYVNHKTRDLYYSTYITWDEWIDVESKKRFLHTTWIVCDLITATYGISPRLLVCENGDIELPCSETLWNARTEDEWSLQRKTSGSERLQTIQNAVKLLSTIGFYGVPESALTWSPFAIVVVAHVLTTHTWHVVNGHERGPSLTLNAATSKAQGLIWSYGPPKESQWTEVTSSFLNNAAATVRIASGTACVGQPLSDRSAMLRGDANETSAAILEYAKKAFPRGQNVTETMAQAFEGLVVPGSGGALIVRKTAPLTWSIEHMVAAWDTVLMVSKWLHTVQSGQAEYHERALTDHISQTLHRNGCKITGFLGSDMVRFWAGFGEEFWVWGVATRMAATLRSLESAYQSVK